MKLERERAVADRAARSRIVVRPVVDELSLDGNETMSPGPTLRGGLRRGRRQESSYRSRRHKDKYDSDSEAAHASHSRRLVRSCLIGEATHREAV